MNKIIQINLGGAALTLDDDAYELLKTYLQKIKRAFNDASSHDELIKDFETRIAELLQEKNPGSSIYSRKNVEAVIAVLGEPEQILEESSSEAGPRNNYSQEDSTFNPGRRLYRHGHDKVVAGVCAGLAQYLGIKDPLWVRIGFVILIWVFGIPIWIYLLLWIVLPEAKSPSEYLEMQGKPINFDNINNIINEGVDKIKSFATSSDTNAGKFNFETKRTIFENFGDFLKKMGGLLLVILGIVILIGAITSFFSFTASLIVAAAFIPSFFGDNTFWNYMMVISLYLLIAIPLFYIIFWFINYLRNRKISPKAYWIGLGTWLLCLIFTIVCGIRLLSDFSTHQYITNELSITQPYGDTLIVVPAQYDKIQGSFHLTKWKISNMNGNPFLGDDIDLLITTSPDQEYHLFEKIGAFGSDENEAQANAKELSAEYHIEGRVLSLPSRYNLSKDSRWRVQAASVELQVPKGKFVKIGEGINHRYDILIKSEDDFKRRRSVEVGDIVSSNGVEISINNDSPWSNEVDIDGDNTFKIKKSYAPQTVTNSPLHIDLDNLPAEINFSKEKFGNYDDIELTIKPSSSGDYNLTSFLSATLDEGRKKLDFKMVEYPILFEGKHLSLSPNFYFSVDQGWVSPKLSIELEIPLNARVTFDKGISSILSSNGIQQYNDYDIDNPSQIWKMTQEGLLPLNLSSDK
ncbi:MAG: PspC domain-containing protein [Saprospiraceae bacterium]|nr:PspC domain-containing protein [Saprospiraceae bacterium]